MANVALISTIGQIEALIDVALFSGDETILLYKRFRRKSLIKEIEFFNSLLSLNNQLLQIKYVGLIEIQKQILKTGFMRIYIARGATRRFLTIFLCILFKKSYIVPDGAVPSNQIIGFHNKSLFKKNILFKKYFFFHKIDDEYNYYKDLNIISIKPQILHMIQIYFSKKNILEKEVLIIGKNKLEIIDQDKIKKYIFKFIELNLINKLYYLPHPRETNSLDISFENKVQINSYINIEAMPEYVISLGSSGIELFRLTKSKRIFLRPMLSDKLTRNSLRSNITADIILDI